MHLLAPPSLPSFASAVEVFTKCSFLHDDGAPPPPQCPRLTARRGRDRQRKEGSEPIAIQPCERASLSIGARERGNTDRRARAGGREAHLFFVVGMTSRARSSCFPPLSKRVKMWLRFGFEMLPLPLSLPPSPAPSPLVSPQMPRWKSSLFLSAILPLVPLFLYNPITKDCFHQGERAIRGLSSRRLLPFEKVDVEG